jgi:hypothetical protein
MMIDISGNGSLADEAALLTGIAAIIGAATGTIVALLRRDVRRNHSKLEEVADTLNRVDEEVIPGETPSVGQRLVRIERQVDSISDSVLSLTGAMTTHIIQEEKKADRIEQRISQVEDTLVDLRETIAPRTEAPAPTVRKRTKRTRPAT